MSDSSDSHSIGDLASRARDIAANAAITGLVGISTLGNPAPGVTPSVFDNPVNGAALTTQLETVTNDASQATEAVHDVMETSEAIELGPTGLGDDQSAEHRDPAPDSSFGADYMANWATFAEQGVDGSAGDATRDSTPDVSADTGPDGGFL